ncbi:hypothetical protein [Caldivirga sp.]|jgi:hypothetical protein|uniref:hypothetical protein n=1 Tax=Caldivirga sp. TaxID=2080243 RepID=UPI0025C022FD|nr:hypothetical protein [Caldivirga sp.]
MEDVLKLMLRNLEGGLVLRGRGVSKIGSRQYSVILPIDYNELWEHLRSKGYSLTIILILEKKTNQGV